MRYNPKKIEDKWQKIWLKKKIYEPDLKHAKKPFYNLMMFPYPSAEGLHIGAVRTFSGVDIYGRMKRMQGYDVFEPMGLDGFGIHSENYALKIGKHPMQHAKDSEKNFYRQLGMMGNGFAWDERLETYHPEYYKWTQWIFTEMFRRGLAYRKKAAVNWCPSCKTVLADEQVIAGKCERCGTEVIKKDLEQWFFRITNYAERLLKNLEKIDWSEKVKIAQKNWIGKSEGALIDFEILGQEKPNFVLFHGYGGAPNKDFLPWLRENLERRGYRVEVPLLPHADKSRTDEKEDLEVALKSATFDRNTVLIGHSLGAPLALKVLERLKSPIRKLVLVGGFLDPRFRDKARPFENQWSWRFNFSVIKKNVADIVVLHDVNDHAIPLDQGEKLRDALGAKLIEPTPTKSHFNGDREPAVLRHALDSMVVFTTRPDTLFGATYMVVAPEHEIIADYRSQIANRDEVEEYVKKAKAKTDEERITEGKGKTGIELKGIKAINPANGEEISIFVADYVLGHVGTGAIMAVPAHDRRDFEFAKRFNLPIKIVVCPHYPETTCPIPDEAYEGEGHLVDSGKFEGMEAKSAKWKITEFVAGEKKIQYRLRDWLVSRQRYWGPPIPMIFCGKCGWQPVPEKDLPVPLPKIKNFKPTGTGRGPLASVKSFYETSCPKCGIKAQRETDVSDAFLDSAWYYLGYLILGKKTPKNKNKKFEFDQEILKKWLPVHMYIGGAEHSVLHLLYSRFLAMAFYDFGLFDFEEPFTKFRAHGLITKDGAKMSKSKGNVVNPDEYIRAYGSDAIRMYLAFLAPLPDSGDFRDTGIKGITRFLERVWKFTFEKMTNEKAQNANSRIQKVLHRTIKKITHDIENLQYNTAISALMSLLNEFEAKPEDVSCEDVKIFLKLLAPMAPYITEELWQGIRVKSKRIKEKKIHSIHQEQWPEYNEAFIAEEEFELIIQVNGKVRGRVWLSRGADKKKAEDTALSEAHIKDFIQRSPQKIIYVQDRLINFVVEE